MGYLMKEVWCPIRRVQEHQPTFPVDRGVVGVDLEQLTDQRQRVCRAGLRAGSQVVVAGVMPSAAVEVGHVLAGLVGRLGGPILAITVEVRMRDGRLERVIQVAGPVPDAVAVFHLHVAHLDREEDIQGRLPDVALVHPWIDLEGGADLLLVAHAIEPGFADL